MVTRALGVRLRGQQWDVIGAIALGGAIGAAARYGIAVAWPAPATGFPWATFATNAVGCALIGVLLVLVTEIWTVGRLVRPFAGTGILGGFTTFSTYAVEVEGLIGAGAERTALVYLVTTPAAALVSVWLAVRVTRWVMRKATL